MDCVYVVRYDVDPKAYLTASRRQGGNRSSKHPLRLLSPQSIKPEDDTILIARLAPIGGRSAGRAGECVVPPTLPGLLTTDNNKM